MKYSKLMLSTAAAVGTILGVGAASAADMPVKARPYVAPPPVFSWTGCYVGGHVGWGWGRQNTSNDFLSFTTSTVTNASGRVDSSGAVFGGQVGCDYQFAGGWVLGAQGSIAAANIWGSNVDPRGAALDTEGFATDSDRFNRVKTDWIADATLRLGYGFGQQMVYVKGGAAWARNRWDVSDTLTGLPFGERLETRTGWTIGVGYEWMWSFAPGWTSFIEYNHYDFGSRNLNTIDDATSFPNGNQSLRFNVSQTIDIAKVGVNYRFNLGKSPVVARY